MIDQALLDVASQQALENGCRLLQGFRLADEDYDHIHGLMHWMNPVPFSHILDIGSGFGDPAWLMRQCRRDLSFSLLNYNEFQIKQSRYTGFPTVRADMHAIPFATNTFDGAMMLYTLCHADNFVKALQEARRVVRPGGFLFVYDYVRDAGNDNEAWELLKARFPYRSEIEALAAMTGWATKSWHYPLGDDTVFRQAFGEHQAIYERLFGPLRPYIWKAQ